MTSPTPAATDGLKVEVLTDLAGAERAWRELETHAVLTPYQRFDWLAAFVAAGGEPGGDVVIVVFRLDERVVALLPLVVERRGGLKRGRLLGSSISNSDWLIVDPAVAPHIDRAAVLRGLSAAARVAGGMDVVTFSNLPANWEGVANPLLAFAHNAAPNNLYIGDVAGNGPFIERGMSSKDRSNIKRAMRRLTETRGPVSVRRVTTAEDLARVHAAFLDQRGRRFAEMGIDNVFAGETFVAFFRDLATQELGRDQPALCFHALYAGEEILATCCGAFAGTHYSQYINSTTDGDAARFYLMGVLMVHLIDELTGEAVTSLDMGLGDFPYKKDWSAPQPVFDSVVPLTLRGRIAAPASVVLGQAKRTVKQNARLWDLARKVRQAAYCARRLLGRRRD
jgi:CelD/BcsL family acetyltransferase involved in cellulose biosynthesis